MDPNTIPASGGREQAGRIQSTADVTVYDTAKTNFLPWAKMRENIDRPIPIVIDDNVIACLPMPSQIPLCRSFFNLLQEELDKAGHGSWSICAVDGQKIQSAIPPGECMVAFRSNVFRSEKEAFKYATENEEKMKLLEYTEDDLEREENGEDLAQLLTRTHKPADILRAFNI